MRKLIQSLPVLSLIALMGTTGCVKEKQNVIPVQKSGNMNVQFEYVFGPNQVPWELGKTFVHSKTGDTLTFTLLKYYVSNIKLQKADGSWWIQPNSYFLLHASSSPDDSKIEVKDIPAGSYKAMEYTMGVDSMMNVSGVYEGALSLINGMFWDWNSGFIMTKFEGKSPNSPSGNFALHLGGFKGQYNVVTVKTADFGNSPLVIKGSNTSVVTLVANPARVWHNAPGVDSISVIHAPGAEAYQMAKDFYNAIMLKSVQ